MDERTFTSEAELGNQEKGIKRWDGSISISKFVILILIMIVAFQVIYMFQLKEKYELEKQEAYVISVLINAQENNLGMKYSLTPKDVGLEGLRDEWIRNPCSKTAHAYSDALDQVLEYLSEQFSPRPNKIGNTIQV